MLSKFSFLDYVWRGLLVGTLTSTIALLIMFLISILLMRRASHLQMKWFFNNQLLLFLFVFLTSFAFVATNDPELATGCFNQFVRISSSFTITRFISGAWLLMVLALFLLDGFRIYASFRQSKSFLLVTDERIKNQLEQSMRHLGLSADLQIYTTKENESPFVWGLFNYKLILPHAALDSLSHMTLRSILAHELIHVRDRDALWLSFELFYRRLMFFNPIVYFISRRHLLTIEKAADEEAIQKGGVQASELLKSLIEVIGFCKQGSNRLMVLNVSRNFKELKERMECLTQVARPVPSRRFFNCIVVISVLLSLGLSGAQAKMAVAGLNEQPHEVGMMCSQLKHEKIIESWLNIEAVPNKCEK